MHGSGVFDGDRSDVRRGDLRAISLVKLDDRAQQDMAKQSRMYLNTAQGRIKKLMWQESKERWRKAQKEFARKFFIMGRRIARKVTTSALDLYLLVA